ncbi:MAG: helicase HerA-like domain-containing protein [Candidatus Micrarchaeota archaeon]
MSNPVLGVTDGSNTVSISAKYLTRHGLIAGSTGTGKSRTMQTIAEQLADRGINVFVSDIKGDASGFCVAGKENKRNIHAPYEPHPIEANYWSVSNRFIPLRFSLSDAGTILISRLLSLNPTQESHLSLAFSHARKKNVPLHTFEELLDVLDVLVKTNARGFSSSSVNVIERKVVALIDSGLGELFGKPSISINDLRGLNVLNLSDSRKNMAVSIAPAFLLQMLFDNLPEKGDVEQPEYVIFFDEAHYLFKDSNKSLQDLMVTILKQIRSKGVSVFFVTQDVTDLPDEILSQLSTKIIFSQKVFTQRGNQRLKALANSFPDSELDVLERLKRMPTGVAITSTLDQKGNQTEPKEVTMFAPATTMEVVEDEILLRSSNPKLIQKYYSKKSKKAENKRKWSETQKEIPIAQEIRKETRKVENPREKNPKKKGPSIWDGLFKFLLKLLDFILKVVGKITTFLFFKPIKKFFKYLTKKPIRIIYFLIILLLIYVIFVNWGSIQSILELLKL